jgi:Pyruvate/2-oxoacid:ferredoxin oxidoreductase gamma subunit
MVMTGKVIRECEGISADHLEEALGKVVSARHADLKEINLKAIQTGMEYAE